MREKAGLPRRVLPRILAALSLLVCYTAASADDRFVLRAGRPLVDIRDPALLSQVEDRGFRFGVVLGAPDAVSTARLFELSSAFRSMHGYLSQDLDALKSDMRASGRELGQKAQWNVGRSLNLDWLRSPHARFRLVGVINRQDRRDFAEISRPGDSCGEIRLIYRLGYRMAPGWLSGLSGNTTLSASRMPFTLNVIYERPRSAFRDCSLAARAAIPERDFTRKEEVMDWLLGGVLAQSQLRLKQVEVNAQVVRLPSETEPEFGGQAIYLMRIFKPSVAAGTLDLVPQVLENTPDSERIVQDATLRGELIAYIRSHIPDIDQGVYQLPDKFLATKALTYSTFGSARGANHPFSALIRPHELGRVPFPKTKLVRSAKGVLARLDNGSCMGCHQSGATAGFHFFGLDDEDALAHNQVQQGTSPHYYAETARREAYITAQAEGRKPNHFRPLSAAPSAVWSKNGPDYQPANLAGSCIVAPSASHLASPWSCRAGTICEPIADNDGLSVEFGQCVPERRFAISAGLACLVGRIRSSSRPFDDRMESSEALSISRGLASPKHICLQPRLGVPGGLSYRRCSPDDLAFGRFKNGNVPDEICGMGGGQAFDRCAATGDFRSCLDASIVRQNRQTCGKDRFCREDYICQALPDEVPGAAEIRKDWGYCSPTYFLFQMRLDGHPDPT
ncbi:hypothetical protein [Microvirga sp. M2]|uniref:hypothetical protein n=1 Tax=Microvirga sp. M2 TaxID=3073270 RepID=UPI0039C4D2A8